MAYRLATALVAATAAAVPSLATAQAWIIETGVTGGGEYNDNYFFTEGGEESAFTGTIAPFLSVARKTENSDVTGLFAVGGNKVWGLPDSSEYVSVRFGLNGSFREARTLWTGNASFLRSPTLQSVSRPTGVILALVTTNTGAVTGSYDYTLTERWSVGATAGWTGNYYDSVDGGINADAFQDNNQYFAGGKLGYAYSDRTEFTMSAVASHYDSDITRSDSLTATVGVAHQVSQQLTVSGSIGGFWSDIKADEFLLLCPTTPILCDTGAVARVPVLSGVKRSESGTLYGGNIDYEFTESTRFLANVSSALSPDGTGSVSKTENAGASLTHRFSELLTGRLGATYTRNKYPVALSGSATTEYYGAEVGVSYQLAERWTLDAAYRYRKGKYSQNNLEPDSNVAFVTIGYNWPGVPMTDWFGAPPEARGAPGAGPVLLPESQGELESEPAPIPER